ncbi:DUF1656 domain-containing protein [Methylocapsa polymorpha]|uniref:DUF1656 domain-containing protein n=1 Tax=Methylocapsa polymorpha TaxID=3080828 RepID=A0ABZ0HPZ4_9HYPH|nr:DUF1656 domain-containing protein [Methylocapsa sp. RX1]
MNEEIDLYGVFIPGLLMWAACAFALSAGIRRLLAECGFYKLVWHAALFDLALFVFVLRCVVFVFAHSVI